MKDKISFILAASLLIVSVLGCAELRKKNPTRSDTPDFEVTLDQLAKEYKNNVSVADSKYGGRTLAITGLVDNKLLGSSVIFAGSREHGFATQCFFDKDEADSLKKVKSRDEITVIGVCMGRDKNDGPLMITKCVLR